MRYEAFIDGSFKEDKESGVQFYESAAIIAPEGTSDWTSLTQCGCEAEYIGMRNVAGETLAAMLVCEYCINHLHLTPNDLLRINYDYKGINSWLLKPGQPDFWKAKSTLAKIWRDYFYAYVKPAFAVEFRHTPGHSGIRGNEIVDKLARETVRKHLQEVTRS